ncbi:nuclear transport factor 2 family protein [Spirosoma sp.]|uniref:nuclear transport factor 2 family protein n=1 Tax=Spirosoma sp. TaxID=1899569 RepID=UPI003B3B4DE8
MKRILFLTFLLASLRAFSQSPTESQISVLSKKKFDWMRSPNSGQLASLMDNNVILQLANGKTQTKNEFLDELRSKRFVVNSITISESLVHVFGETAIVTGKLVATVTANNKNSTINKAYTEVYTRQSGQWKMVLFSI